VIVRISSTIVPEPMLNDHLERVQKSEIRVYETAPGLHSVWLLERPFVGFVEVVTVSVWRSEAALNQFLRDRPPVTVEKKEHKEHDEIQLDARLYGLVMACKGPPADPTEEPQQ
jgi:heme-degrading monooxygenase HmoA